MNEIRNPHGGYIGDNNLFPFRTEKLNSSEPMVLQFNVGELVTAKWCLQSACVDDKRYRHTIKQLKTEELCVKTLI